MSESARLLRVGLTGGIACGKSHVLRRLAESGLATIDLDDVAHEVLSPGGSAYHDVVAAFGLGILGPDGTIDRKALGELVFADPEALARLGALIHPKVRAEEAQYARELEARGEAILVTDAALLVEAGIHLRFDRLVVAYCSSEEQLRRLTSRDGLPEGAARARIASQMPQEEKRRYAHFVIDTSGSLEETDRAVEELVGELRALASREQLPGHLPLERGMGCLLRGPKQGPRGLTPRILLDAIAEWGGLEMERIAALLQPPSEGPWYLAARAGSDEPGPEALMCPLVLWALARGGADEPFLVAVAASLARLLHVDPIAVAGGCLFALALAELAARGRDAQLEGRLGEWCGVAERWGGGPPPRRVVAVVEEAARRLSTAQEANQDEASVEAPDELVGALLGMALGVPESTIIPKGLCESVQALARLSQGPS